MEVSITLSNHMQKGYFSQEILLSGKKGYLKAEGTRIKGVLTGADLSNGDCSMKDQEVILYEDGEDDELSLSCKNDKNLYIHSFPLLPPIYLAGKTNTIATIYKI